MKYTLILVAMLCVAIATRAQNEKGDIEITGSLGVISDMYLFTSIDQGFAGDNPNPMPTGADLQYFISARYFVGKRIALGVTCGAETINGATVSGQYSTQYIPYTYKTHYYTLAAEFTFIYKKLRGVEIYSNYGLGESFFKTSGSYPLGTSFPADNENNKVSGTFVNAYVSPIGFRFGKVVAGFIQLGLGYKGLVSGGISYTIKTRTSNG